MTRIVALVCALVAAVALAPASAAAPPLVKHTHPATAASPERDYYVSIPDGPVRGLVLFLHGCNQTIESAAVGTRFHDRAALRRYAVVYAEQRVFNADYSDGNGSRCWNWFRPEHQSRGRGEPATLAGITLEVARETGVDPGHVFVAGISAGADMTTVLGATYPDVFAAIAPYAGCAYLTCADVAGEAAYRAMGDHARLVPTFIAQGSADMVNNAAMGDTALRQWLATNDLADDGARNFSVSSQPSSQEHVGADEMTPAPGSGDPCVGNSRLPCASGPAGTASYPYTISRYTTASGDLAVEHWLIHGLNHAYPGGDTEGSFVDPAGPDMTTAMLDFFERTAGSAVVSAASASPATRETSGAASADDRGSTTQPAELPATGSSSGTAVALFAVGAGLYVRRKLRMT